MNFFKVGNSKQGKGRRPDANVKFDDLQAAVWVDDKQEILEWRISWFDPDKKSYRTTFRPQHVLELGAVTLTLAKFFGQPKAKYVNEELRKNLQALANCLEQLASDGHSEEAKENGSDAQGDSFLSALG